MRLLQDIVLHYDRTYTKLYLNQQDHLIDHSTQDAEEEDLDVYEVDDEWGTLVTDETKGIFTPILDAIAKRTPKMLSSEPTVCHHRTR